MPPFFTSRIFTSPCVVTMSNRPETSVNSPKIPTNSESSERPPDWREMVVSSPQSRARNAWVEETSIPTILLSKIAVQQRSVLPSLARVGKFYGIILRNNFDEIQSIFLFFSKNLGQKF